MDVRTDEAGNQKMVPRTPLLQALEQLFKEKGTIVLGRQAGRQVGRQAACASEIGIGLLSCMGQV